MGGVSLALVYSAPVFIGGISINVLYINKAPKHSRDRSTRFLLIFLFSSMFDANTCLYEEPSFHLPRRSVALISDSIFTVALCIK